MKQLSNKSQIIWDYPVKDNYRYQRKYSERHAVKIEYNSTLNKVYFGLLSISLFILMSFLSVTISRAGTREVSSDFRIHENSKSTIDDLKKFAQDNHDKVSDSSPSANEVILKNIQFSKYRIKNNENIENIARRMGITYESIVLSNFIKNKKEIKNGLLVLIPNQNGRLIIVKPNDSIQRIAARYGVSWKQIVDVNNLSSERINPGQKIFIPGSQMTRFEKQQFQRIEKKKSKTQSLVHWPLRGEITSRFGMRQDPFKKIYIFHSGIDIRGSVGDPVKSCDTGTVSYIGWTNIYGNFVLIKHKSDVVSLYGHLNSIEVKRGDTVNTETIIGTVGNTGRSTGPHLHFEMRKNNIPVDPLKYLNQAVEK